VLFFSKKSGATAIAPEILARYFSSSPLPTSEEYAYFMSTNFAKTLVWKYEYDIKL